MLFLAQADLAVEPNFLRRVTQASIAAAVAVQSELGSTSNHVARIALAAKVLNGTPNVIPRFALAIVTNASITSASPDADLQFTVNSLWDAFANGVWP